MKRLSNYVSGSNGKNSESAVTPPSQTAHTHGTSTVSHGGDHSTLGIQVALVFSCTQGRSQARMCNRGNVMRGFIHLHTGNRSNRSTLRRKESVRTLGCYNGLQLLNLLPSDLSVLPSSVWEDEIHKYV